MIDIFEKSFAHLDERPTAVENRSRRDVGGDVTGLSRRETKAVRRAESPDLSLIGSFRKLPPVRGGAGGNSRAVEPMQTHGNDQEDRGAGGASGVREGMSRPQKGHGQREAQNYDADHELGGDPAVRGDRGSQFYRAASGAGRVPVGGAHVNRNRTGFENEKHRADRPSDGSRKQALPGRVDLRPSQREDVAVQFRDNDSVVMSEDDRMSEKARKAWAREMKLEKFDGTSSIDSFLAKFDICSRHNEWTEEDRMVHLQCAMVHNAAQILWDMGSEGVAKSSDFIAQLRARYGSANQTTLYRTQLKYRRRNRGESLAALMNDIRRMVVLVYPGPTSPMKEAVACDAFLEALGDAEMALKIREREPPTLEDAFQYALRLEAHSGSAAVKLADGDRRGHVRMLQEVQVPEDRCLEYLKEMGCWPQENFQQYFSEMRAALNGQPKANQEVRVKVADSQPETPSREGGGDGRHRLSV